MKIKLFRILVVASAFAAYAQVLGAPMKWH